MANKTVLVIDADSETEQLIASTLESEGYLVFSVPGGDVGAEMAQKVSPSLIFINPAEAGLDTCRAIHEVESLKKVPIILLTSPSGTIDQRSASAAGAADFLEVPCSPEELLEKTDRTLDVKAPIVLHVKEKSPEHGIGSHDALADTEQGPSDVDSVEVAPASAEIFELEEPDEEISPAGGSKKVETTAHAPDYSYDDEYPEEKMRPAKKSNKIIVAVAVVVIVIAGAAGFLFYSGLVPGIGPGKTVPVKPLHTMEKPKTVASTQETQEPAPSKEEQKEQPVSDTKTVVQQKATSSQAPPPPSSPQEKKETTPLKNASPASTRAEKSSGKKVYSVQLGVFKSEDNAAGLTKQFTEKGYDVFMIKSPGKDNGPLYRVLVGKSEDRKESARLAAKIRDKEKIKTIIYSE